MGKQSDDELIVLMDENGQPIGGAPKLESHHANTPLHLGFSCYIFNSKGELLVTQRARSKKVWPGVWSNAVCGHPAPGEEIIGAIKRRLKDELGMAAKDFKAVLPNYRYQTPPFNGVIENEICPVYFARTTDEPKLNPKEVEAYKWMSWQDFVKAAENDTKNQYSYWCKDQLKQLKSHPLLNKFMN